MIIQPVTAEAMEEGRLTPDVDTLAFWVASTISAGVNLNLTGNAITWGVTVAFWYPVRYIRTRLYEGPLKGIV